MRLLFCGDIMPGGVLPYQKEYVSSELKSFLKGFDYRIGTLEAAIGTDLPYDPVKLSGRQNIVFARNEDFYRVKELGFDIVSLANNHIWDLCEEGLKNTITLIEKNAIKHCGAGLNSEEAARPVIISKDGIKIAILSYCMYGNKYLGYVELAAKDKAGVNPLDIDTVLQDIKRVRKEYDKVIIMPHWGQEYRYTPLPECIAMAKKMIEAGADAVLGSHTHQIQPFIQYKGKPICFSMGNFLFPDFYMRPPRPIWYPDEGEDLTKIKDVVGYPYPIEENLRQVWNPVSRYGCVVILEYEKGKEKASVQYVHLSDSNIVSLSKLPSQIKKNLFTTRLSINNRPYQFIYNILDSIRRKR